MQKKIAFQGTFGANSDLACRQFYPDFISLFHQSFSEVFEAVTKGKVALGMIPLENSYAGRVAEIHNLLQSQKVAIVAEHFFKVRHHLAVCPGTKFKEVKEVYSHPQALMQCRLNLAKLGLKPIDYSNTAQAALMIASQKDKSKAALCSELAANLHGLELITWDLQDSESDNLTIFVAIAKKPLNPDPVRGPVITTLLFAVRNVPGALYKVLGGFATNNVNMIKLESYIPGGISKQAQFFISIAGHPLEKNVALALEEMKFFSESVKIIGVYYADPARLSK